MSNCSVGSYVNETAKICYYMDDIGDKDKCIFGKQPIILTNPGECVALCGDDYLISIDKKLCIKKCDYLSSANSS